MKYCYFVHLQHYCMCRSAARSVPKPSTGPCDIRHKLLSLPTQRQTRTVHSHCCGFITVPRLSATATTVCTASRATICTSAACTFKFDPSASVECSGSLSDSVALLRHGHKYASVLCLPLTTRRSMYPPGVPQLQAKGVNSPESQCKDAVPACTPEFTRGTAS